MGDLFSDTTCCQGCIYSCEGKTKMDCIDLAEDRNQWRAIVNMVMNFWVP
jgi:hypothetical protein